MAKAKAELMDFELLQGTHSSEGSPVRNDKPAMKYVKLPGGPPVFLKDHRDLVEIFPNKFRRIYPEQMRAILNKIDPNVRASVEEPDVKNVPEGQEADGAELVKQPKAGLKEMPAGAKDVTDTFPSAGKNDFIVLHLEDKTYSIFDKDDGVVRADGIKTVIQVRKWLKENVEDDGEE